MHPPPHAVELPEIMPAHQPFPPDSSPGTSDAGGLLRQSAGEDRSAVAQPVPTTATAAHEQELRDSLPPPPGEAPAFDGAGDGDCRALLARGCHFKGTLAFEGFARIDGTLKGKVVGSGLLTLGPTAEVEGLIQVANLIVLGGRVRGEVRVSESVELAPGSDVLAELEAESLYAADGAMISGNWNVRQKPVSLAVEAFPPWLERAPR